MLEKVPAPWSLHSRTVYITVYTSERKHIYSLIPQLSNVWNGDSHPNNINFQWSFGDYTINISFEMQEKAVLKINLLKHCYIHY